jgi:hypothetical protein
MTVAIGASTITIAILVSAVSASSVRARAPLRS